MFAGSWEPELIPQFLRCKWRKEIWNFSEHLVEVEGKGRSPSASPIGFRSRHGGAILGSFCLFFSYLKLFCVCMHDQMNTIRAPCSCCRGPGASPTSPCLHCLLGHRGAGDKTKLLAAWRGASLIVGRSHRREDGGTQKAPFWLLVGLAAGGRRCWRGKFGWGERGVL